MNTENDAMIRKDFRRRDVDGRRPGRRARIPSRWLAEGHWRYEQHK
jgi:hypothetical protein